MTCGFAAALTPRRARAVAPGSEAMFELQAYLLRAEGRFDEAIVAYKATHARCPRSVRYHVDLAQSLIVMGRSAEAVPLLEEAIRRSDVAAPRFCSLWGARPSADPAWTQRRSNRLVAWLPGSSRRGSSSNLSPACRCLCERGRIEDARRELRDYVKQQPTSTLRVCAQHESRRQPLPTSSSASSTAWPAAACAIHVDEDVDAGAD